MDRAFERNVRGSDLYSAAPCGMGGCQGGAFSGAATVNPIGESHGSASRIWQSLLDKTAHPSHLVQSNADAQWNYDPAAKTLLVTTSELSMFSLGETIEIASAWKPASQARGNLQTWVFWGLHAGETDDGNQLAIEAIYLHLSDGGKLAYRLNREWLDLSPKGSECALANRKQYVVEFVEPPAMCECSLEILALSTWSVRCGSRERSVRICATNQTG